MEWYPALYGYDPYTNTILPLTDYAGWNVQYSWNIPPDHHQHGHIQHLSPYSRGVPLGNRPRQAAVQRGRGRYRSSFSPARLPPPRRRAGAERSSSRQPPAAPPVQPPVPVPPPPAASTSSSAGRSPSSHTMTPPVPVPMKNSDVVDVTMTDAAAKPKKDGAQGDDLLVAAGLSGSSKVTKKKRSLEPGPPPPLLKNSDVIDVTMIDATAKPKKDGAQEDDLLVAAGLSGNNIATNKKRMLVPVGPPPPPLMYSDVDMSGVARRDDDQGDVLGLNVFMAKKKRLLSKKASRLGVAAEEEAAANDSKKKSRLGWGQGLAKYEKKGFKKDDEDTNTLLLVADDGASGEPSPPQGSKGHGDNNKVVETRLSQVTTEPAFYKRSSPLTEDNSDSCIRSSTNMTTMVASELASSQRSDPPPGDTSNSNNENSLRSEKVVVIFVPKPKKVLDKNVLSDGEERQTYELHNENDAAPLLSGKTTIRATKNYGRINTQAEDVKKPVNQICHESTANLLAHRLSGHGESSMDENEHETGEVLVGESNAAPSPHGMRSSQAVSLIISKTEAPVLENLNKDSCSIEAICTTKSSSKGKENVTQSVLIANHGDEGNCVAGGSCGQQDTMEIMSLPDESCAKLANGTIKGDQIRSGAKTPEACPLLKECNAAAKHHSWKATEKKVANSNVDDSRKAPSDMKNPNSEDNPCITSDPAATLTGPAFVQHLMKADQKMERDSQKNEDKINGKEGNNPALCVASKECGGIQMSCEVNSHKEIENVESVPGPDGNDLNADMQNPTTDSSPFVSTDAAVVIDNGLIQRLGASEAMYEDKDAKVKSMEGNPAQSFASKEWSGIQSSCHVTSRKGKEKVDIIPSPEVYDLNSPTMQMSNDEAPKTYHLASISCSSQTVHASSSHVERMDIDLNVPLDVTTLDVTAVNLENSDTEACMGLNNGPGEETDSDATIEDIRPSQTIAVPQTAQRLPANQPGSIRLFGCVIYQAPSTTGTTTHFPNQGNQIVFSSSNTLPSSSVVPVTRTRGGQIYPPSGATTNSIWRSIFPNNQQGQQAVLSSNRIAFGGGSASGSAAVSPLQLHQHGSNNALVNITVQQRQQALVSMSPYSIMRGGVPVVPSNLVPGSNGSASLINFNGFSSVQQQWPVPVLDTSRMMFGYPYPSYYFPTGTTTGNQAPATASTMPSTSGTNNGEGASTSNTRAPPAAGRGRDDPNSWLSLDRN